MLACRWTGTVTEIMPPSYGIVDHVAFYHNDVVAGQPPAVVGQQVEVEGIPNLDGGKYEWRLISVRLHHGMQPARGGRVSSQYQMPTHCTRRCWPLSAASIQPLQIPSAVSLAHLEHVRMRPWHGLSCQRTSSAQPQVSPRHFTILVSGATATLLVPHHSCCQISSCHS